MNNIDNLKALIDGLGARYNELVSEIPIVGDSDVRLHLGYRAEGVNGRIYILRTFLAHLVAGSAEVKPPSANDTKIIEDAMVAVNKTIVRNQTVDAYITWINGFLVAAQTIESNMRKRQKA